MSDDVYYLRKARELTAASDDPSTKVGVVIVSNDARHVSFRKTVFGVNSLPAGIEPLEPLPARSQMTS